jgi:signal transduction histidine kinase
MPGVQGTPTRSDLALAATLTLVSLIELQLSYAFERTTEPGPTWVHVVATCIAGGALVWRRVHPLWAAPILKVALVAQPVLSATPNTYGPVFMQLVAVYSLTAYARNLRSALLPGAVVAALGVLSGFYDPDDRWGTAVTDVVVTGLCMTVGEVARRYRSRAESMQLERDEVAAHAARAVAEERVRIARELHDVVAHGMSVVVLQARGARQVQDEDPAATRAALDDIERVAAQCLDEMRRLLGILRSPDGEAAPMAPQPTLAMLRHLVDDARASGASVDLVVDGPRRDLSPGVELSAYRIAQEALTNALKHASGSHTTLHVAYEPDALVIEVDDDGPGTQGDARGHGLIGMRERVELFGGTLSAGALPSGGFGVRARLPVAEAVP